VRPAAGDGEATDLAVLGRHPVRDAPAEHLRRLDPGERTAARRRHAEAEIALHLEYIDKRLADRPFLLGDSLTGADVPMSFVGELAGVSIDRSVYPNLDAWVRRFQARPAYQAALARGGPYSFAQ
jgi:glutathione S-transferase